MNLDPNSVIADSGSLEESQSFSRNTYKQYTTTSISKNNSRFFTASRRKRKKSVNKKQRVHTEKREFSRKSPYFPTAEDHPGAQMVADKLKGEVNAMKLSLVSRKRLILLMEK